MWGECIAHISLSRVRFSCVVCKSKSFKCFCFLWLLTSHPCSCSQQPCDPPEHSPALKCGGLALPRLLLLVLGTPSTISQRGYLFTGDSSVVVTLSFLSSLSAMKWLLLELPESLFHLPVCKDFEGRNHLLLPARVNVEYSSRHTCRAPLTDCMLV